MLQRQGAGDEGRTVGCRSTEVREEPRTVDRGGYASPVLEFLPFVQSLIAIGGTTLRKTTVRRTGVREDRSSST
ncbi:MULTISPECIES: hypothetical protein [unclassified Methanoculleus]|uniref:hypothetical protein n=1 Tax=unclassified Methanoculleus TaxID=2619537 RepID=UPI0025EF1DA9|nr:MULTISPECIES: hypothetical protein [unclassified Methanoculleus]MDD2252883.1 hypothetical protein [Methanoculleus sp.]MDD2788748.1 hypothetical protein [Methanoculleus sp.]MDD3215700.1 hypothetical protein [Methanoculleus sp.]MDD4313541.1 hypothetical protein [Methanoculleus sp.]MDD4469880.1 hypothetical protein [Methanoculleus sp.]